MQDKLTMLIGSDDFAECPQCSRRLETDHDVVETDEMGPVYLGRCEDHGEFRFQVVDSEEDS